LIFDNLKGWNTVLGKFGFLKKIYELVSKNTFSK